MSFICCKLGEKEREREREREREGGGGVDIMNYITPGHIILIPMKPVGHDASKVEIKPTTS